MKKLLIFIGILFIAIGSADAQSKRNKKKADTETAKWNYTIECVGESNAGVYTLKVFSILRDESLFPSNFSKKQINSIIFQGIKRSERYRNLKNEGKSQKEIDENFDIKVNTTLFSWNGDIDTLISPRDSVIYNKFFIHTGLMSMNPNTGEVKAYVGGIDHRYFKYDHVLKGKRQKIK